MQHRCEWKGLWCSNKVWLLSAYIDMNGKICGAWVQFSCYQHRYEWKLHCRVCVALVQFGCYQHRRKWMCVKAPIYMRLSLEVSCYTTDCPYYANSDIHVQYCRKFSLDKNFACPSILALFTGIFSGINFRSCCKNCHRFQTRNLWDKKITHESSGQKKSKFSPGENFRWYGIWMWCNEHNYTCSSDDRYHIHIWLCIAVHV